MPSQENATTQKRATIKLFLCGDVMLGRGIDQILPHPSSPRLYESFVTDARDYVALAERINGQILKPVDYEYIWGDALEILAHISPDIRIINLETAITGNDNYWQGKGINYRMHPGNLPCLKAAEIDCCVLANNHVLDWGFRGLSDTLNALHAMGIQTAGAGSSLEEAWQPACFKVSGKGRVLVFSLGHTSSGIPQEWAATAQQAGVVLEPQLSAEAVQRVAAQVQAHKSEGDIVVASIHWGGNWGYQIPQTQRHFARQLIDEAKVDVVHGHSSHHPKGIEIYHERPIIYGCGDLLNDYEGINGEEAYRGDLSIMYFPELDSVTGRLKRFGLYPMKVRRFSLARPSQYDIDWLAEVLNREGQTLGTRVRVGDDGELILQW